jgi:DNA-binding transcriptional ArsR family regulator
VSQRDILEFVRCHGIVNICEIREALDMSQPSASRKIRQLEKTGFLIVEQCKNNVMYVRMRKDGIDKRHDRCESQR